MRSRLAACRSECILHSGGGAESHAAALAAAEEAVSLATPADLAAARCQLARCHWAQQDTAQAEAAYRQALEAAQQGPAPGLHLPAALGLAELLAGAGRADEAVPLLQRAREQLAAVEAGRAEAADAASRAAGDVAGWSELLLLHQAGMLSLLGELEGAKAAALAADDVAAGRGQAMQVLAGRG